MKQYELFPMDLGKGKSIIKVPSVSSRLSKILTESGNRRKINEFEKLIENENQLKEFIKNVILSNNYKGQKFIFNFKHYIVVFEFNNNGFLVSIEIDDSKWVYDFNIKKFRRVVISQYSKKEKHINIFKTVLKNYFQAKKEYIPEIKLSRYEEFLME